MVTAQPLTNMLCDGLREVGYTQLVVWNPVTGFSVNTGLQGTQEPADMILSIWD